MKMANTALGAKIEQVQFSEKITRTITFKNKEHEKFYIEYPSLMPIKVQISIFVYMQK